MPKISVISIAKDEEELNSLKEALSKQTYKDFEFITSTKGTIPEARNAAISKANGSIIVFIDSNAIPLKKDWLEEIEKSFEANSVMHGLEIKSQPLTTCNLVCDSSVLKKVKFNEKFPVGEDTEFFARLKEENIKVKQTYSFPVIHDLEISWRKTLSRAFRYGHLNIKVIYLHGRENIESVNTQNLSANQIHPISNRIRIITENVLVLLGLAFGLVYHLPTLVKRKINNQKYKNRTKRFFRR